MNEYNEQIKELFDRVPRRHTSDNVKDMYTILEAYEGLLMVIETNAQFEQRVAPFFNSINDIKSIVKKSNDNKASKKMKDMLFDEASGALKDALEELQKL